MQYSTALLSGNSREAVESFGGARRKQSREKQTAVWAAESVAVTM